MSGKKLSKLRHYFSKSSKYGEGKNGRAEQVGALCMRTIDGKRKVLLITSRETKRWIIPKGWKMKGLSDGQAAAQEAWEEAGVSAAKPGKKPIGYYKYQKRMPNGALMPVKVAVYRLKVQEMAKKFPEKGQRKRAWVSPKRASTMVREPDLKKLLISLQK